MFYVGQKVVCVDDLPVKGRPYSLRGLVAPTKGMTYTVRDFYVDPFDSNLRMRLCEIRNPARTWKGGYIIEGGWGLFRFRPVTDISTLQAIVAEVQTGKPRKIKADQFDKRKAGA